MDRIDTYMENIKLRNGMEIPQIGLGTWQITDRAIIKQLISHAYNEGYRLIDTAAAYSNEIAIAKAMLEMQIPRETMILSDKVWNTSRGYEGVQDACRRSLKKMKTDYLDIYLVHWPASMKLYSDWAEINAETWRGMEQLYKEGLVRAIGVCNFKVHHLEELKKMAKVMPLINQIEFHPGMNQQDILTYCSNEQIQIEASSPLGNGQVLTNDRLIGIAGGKKKSVAQVCLRWGLQKGAIVIPKTSNVNRLAENLDVYDFELTEKEMILIDNIPYCGGIGIDSDEVIEFG